MTTVFSDALSVKSIRHNTDGNVSIRTSENEVFFFTDKFLSDLYQKLSDYEEDEEE